MARFKRNRTLFGRFTGANGKHCTDMGTIKILIVFFRTLFPKPDPNTYFRRVLLLAEPLGESMYSTVPTAATVDQTSRPKDVTARTQEVYRAQFDYDAQGAQEISFKAGDLIKLHYKEDDTWWCGECHGKKGMFPKAFVELVIY